MEIQNTKYDKHVIGDNVALSFDNFYSDIDTLKQDCIAVLYDNYEGELIYNTRFPKGVKKLEFDPEYFIDAYDKTMLKAKNFK